MRSRASSSAASAASARPTASAGRLDDQADQDQAEDAWVACRCERRGRNMQLEITGTVGLDNDLVIARRFVGGYRVGARAVVPLAHHRLWPRAGGGANTR